MILNQSFMNLMNQMPIKESFFMMQVKEEYPTDKMINLCKDYTGLDTAQIKCKEKDQTSLVVCEYKCSLHWLTKKKDKFSN